MAAITLRKSKFDSFGDMLDGLLSKLGSYDATVKDLKNTVASVGCENDNQVSSDLGNAIDDIVNSEESKEEKKEKINALKQKIGTFVNNAVQHEKAAADKIKEKKKEFYKNYEYLRPNCETTLGSIWEAIKTKAKQVGEWIKENALAIIIAAVIVVAAIIVCVFCPAAVIAIIGIIVSALSAVMGIADLVCMAFTGKDVATWLAEDMHLTTLSQIYKGLGWGLDIASIILPVGAGIKSAMTVGKQTFTQASKTVLKQSWNGVKEGFAAFKTACKSDGIMKTLGKTSLKILGFDDIAELKNIGKFKNNSLIPLSSKHWDVDLDNMCMTPKSSEASAALKDASKKLKLEVELDSVPLTKNGKLIDVDWDAISMKIELPNGDTITHLDMDQGFDMKNLGFGGAKGGYDNALDKFMSTKKYDGFDGSLRGEIYGKPSSRVNDTLNGALKTDGVRYTSMSIDKKRPNSNGIFNVQGFTAHENYNMMYEHFVPSELHNFIDSPGGINHTGGIAHLKSEIRMIRNIDHLFVRSGVSTGINLLAAGESELRSYLFE